MKFLISIAKNEKTNHLLEIKEYVLSFNENVGQIYEFNFVSAL